MEHKKEHSNLIKEVLKKRGITQTWLAKELGMNFSITNAYVRNRKQPNLATIFKEVGLLGVSPKDLINKINMGLINYTNPIFSISNNTIFFFDMDGTLVNTNLANFLSYKKAISLVLNIELSPTLHNQHERFNRCRLKELFPTLSDANYKKIILLKEVFYKEFLPETTIIKENVEILLKYSGINKMVLVSNCRKERALETLSFHGLADKFSDLFYREINPNKQRINKYQNAIDLLGISPNDIIVFENEEVEIADAIEANIKTINPKILL